MTAQYQLIMRSGPTPGAAFMLEGDQITIGRDPTNSITINDAEISRRHARIWREGANFLVEDLGSSNGTVVASTAVDSFRLVPHKPHVLSSGDKLRVGDTTLHFLIG